MPSLLKSSVVNLQSVAKDVRYEAQFAESSVKFNCHNSLYGCRKRASKECAWDAPNQQFRSVWLHTSKGALAQLEVTMYKP